MAPLTGRDMDQFDFQVNIEGVESIRAAAASTTPVTGLTHTFYRYPARFSPQFARAAISEFTEPGDLVIDPFMGGGTTLVEALALGRQAIGTDISSLASFVSSVKTTLLSNKDREALDEWIDLLPRVIRINRQPNTQCTASDLNYQRNLDNPKAWRIRKGIKLGLESLPLLNNTRQEQFARCVLLNTAQWALDGRKEIPTISAFRIALEKHYKEMQKGEIDLNRTAKQTGNHNIYSAQDAIKCLHRSAIGLENDLTINSAGAPRLILASPPYPGIHVLYHRWQINGGRETATPFWIANKLDGSGESFYTLGHRNQKGLVKYFSQIKDVFRSLAEISSEKTTVIQMVSFSQPEWQLPKYLEAMKDAGFSEVKPYSGIDSPSDRIWRNVPQRKWHANLKGKTQGSREVVLFHRLSNSL